MVGLGSSGSCIRCLHEHTQADMFRQRRGGGQTVRFAHKQHNALADWIVATPDVLKRFDGLLQRRGLPDRLGQGSSPSHIGFTLFLSVSI